MIHEFHGLRDRQIGVAEQITQYFRTVYFDVQPFNLLSAELRGARGECALRKTAE